MKMERRGGKCPEMKGDIGKYVRDEREKGKTEKM